MKTSLYQERTSLRVYFIAIIIFIIGVLLIYWSSPNQWLGNKEPLTTVVGSFGIVLLTTVSLGLIWELFVRRAFLEEFYTRVGIAAEIRTAGLIGYTDKFYEAPEWADYFKKANSLDIFFAYGSTWRKINKQNLEEFIRRGGILRVVLPDPDNPDVTVPLAKRFSYTQEDLISRINDALDFFKTLKSSNPEVHLNIWLISKQPLFTFYRFDGTIILTMYQHRNEQVPIPTFIAVRSGKLFEFVNREFEAMVKENGLAKKVL